MSQSFAVVPRPRPFVRTLSAAAILASGLAAASGAHAGANVGARAQLSFSPDSLTTSLRTVKPGILRLYVWLDGARRLKGAEYTVRWHAEGGDSLLSVLGEKHSSGEECGQYLMRGHSIQVPEANLPNAWGIAFASDEADTTCHSGALSEIVFDATALGTRAASFALTDVKLLDDASEADPVVTVGPLRVNGAGLPSPADGPHLTEIAPRGVRTVGGATLTATGERFTPGTRVFVGGTEARDVTIVDAKHLTFTAPAHAAANVDARVEHASGLAGWLRGALVFTDAPPPTIQDVLPDTVGILRPLTIRGTGFTPGTRVRIGGMLSTDVHFVTSSLLTAIVPLRRAGDASVQVENPDGLTADLDHTIQLLSSSSGD